MGSNQSSVQSGGSFSIDPSGNITTTKATNSSKTADNIQKYKENSNKENKSMTTPIDEPPSFIVPTPIVDIFDDQPSKQTDNNKLGLKEADEIVTNLKIKYKPNSEEMAGKQQSVFEEVERNLVQCYVNNKGQPMNCSKVVEEYKDYVAKQRSQLLKKSVVSGVPLITTILVILTCLLMHITTISCFGAMSIDLGSEWMKVGLVAPSVQMDIVLNAQSQRKTPMAIAFSNGERFIGETALDVASKYPERTYTHFLDLVGKTIDHESVNYYKQRFPYANITSHEPNSTSILLNHPEGFNFTPLELIAMMIQHAHEQVTNRLNSDEPTYDVVITVPPFFNSIERRVIADAARLIGLNILRLTNVNSAFALSYGIFRHKDYLPESSENKTSILFFDQGASHTSATLADYYLVEQFDERTGLSKNESLPTVSIRAQVYDRYLGGFDMQLKLRDYLVNAFAKETKIDEKRIYGRGRSSAKLLKESGRVKKILSANNDHVVRVENVIDDKDLKQRISRREFEELNQDYLDKKITQLLDTLFEMPNVVRYDPLESVIIVGGNTRTPKIQQVLLDYFKLNVLGKSINADEGAALAALYQAASLGRGFRVKKFVLEEFGEERRRFDPVAAAAFAADHVSSTQQPTDIQESSTEAPVIDSTTTTQIEDPDSIYSEFELKLSERKLNHLREKDFLRLQRLSLKNNLESLLSEAREKVSGDDDDDLLKDRKEELQKMVSDTSIWLEDGPQQETDNVTILTDKFNSIYEIIHPRPPPVPPTLQFDPATVDLSSVFNNTMDILDKLNFTNPFGESENGTELPSTETGEATSTQETPPVSSQHNQSSTIPTPVKTGSPPHSEL